MPFSLTHSFSSARWDLLTQPPMLDVGLNTLQLSYLSRAQQNEKNGKHEIDSKETENLLQNLLCHC
jgi:hypothetical protein